MNWRNIYPGLDWICTYFGFILVATTCASATIGILYLQDPFETVFQYLPAVASMLYFIGRILFVAYNRLTVSTNEILGYAFIATTAVALVGQAALNIDFVDQNNISSWAFTSAVWVFSTFYFFAGASSTRATYKKSNIIAIILLLLVVVPLLTATDGKLLLDYYQMRIKLENPDFTHLYISEFCVFFFFSAYAFADWKLRPVVIVVSFCCLFALQGRSSTFFTLGTLLLFAYLIDGKKVLISIIAIAAVVFAAFLILPNSEILYEASDSKLDRMLLTQEDGDSSAQGRAALLEKSIYHLPSSIPFGDPSFIAKQWGKMGSYIHNLLSMWQFFGLLPFLLIVVILYRSVRLMLRTIKTRQLTVMEEIASMLLIYCVVGVLTTKAILLYWLWFSTGYWMLRYSTETHGKGRKQRRRRSRSRRSSKGKSKFGKFGLGKSIS